MEEVIGSIPIRSTNKSNNIAESLSEYLVANFNLPRGQPMSSSCASFLKLLASNEAILEESINIGFVRMPVRHKKLKMLVVLDEERLIAVSASREKIVQPFSALVRGTARHV
ncbi:MAG: hypothetical protein PW735_12910 [Acidobacteriaceae bacterium]|nr:hypothetical protein [Acidobacteriaceae bacterium]